MKFYLGTHQPGWLARDLGVPFLVSHRRLAGRRTLPRATTSWACDSGGFVELSLHGRWRTNAATYVAAVRRYATEIGRLDWAAPMDHMVEQHVLARTGATVETHQRRTVAFTDWLSPVGDLRSGDFRQRCVALYRSVQLRQIRKSYVSGGLVLNRIIIGKLRVQQLVHGDGRKSFTIVLSDGSIHQEADEFLRLHGGSGTQKTYAYYLVDHLRWREREGLRIKDVSLRDLHRYMGAVGAKIPMP